MDENNINIIRQRFLESLADTLPMRQFQFAHEILDAFTTTISNSDLVLISNKQLNSLIDREESLRDNLAFQEVEKRIPDTIPDLKPITKENKDQELKARIEQLENTLANIKSLNDQSRNYKPLNIDISKFRHIEEKPIEVEPPMPPPTLDDIDNEEEDFNDEKLTLEDDPEYDERGIDRVPVEKAVEDNQPEKKMTLQERMKKLNEERKAKKTKVPNVYN